MADYIYYVTVSGGTFLIDGEPQAELGLKAGLTYRFDVSDSSCVSQALKFSTTSDGTHGGGSEYTTGVTVSGTAGSSGAFVDLVAPSSTGTLYYYNGLASGYGGTILHTTDTYVSTTNLGLKVPLPGASDDVWASHLNASLRTIDSVVEGKAPLDSPVFTGVIKAAAGAEATPSITPTSDPNTGVYFPAADIVGVSTNGSERMRIDSSGNVGIGTNSPSRKLELSENTTSGGPYIQFRNRGTSANHTDVYGIGGIIASAYRDVSNPSNVAGVWFDRKSTTGGLSSGGDIVFGAMSNGSGALPTERMRIDYSGNVDIANLGSGTVYSNNGVLTNANPSDANLKENVVPIQYGLESIKQLNPIEFDWIADETDKHELGFIAQEVQQVIPDLVTTYEYTDEETEVTETRFGLESTQFIPVLVKALQDQQAIIESLEQRIAALETASA